MLKRKSGNYSSAILTKKLKKPVTPKKGIKYNQKTLSQTLFCHPKPIETQIFSLYPEIYGVISSYIKLYKKKIASKDLNSDSPEKSIIVQGPAGCGKTHFIRRIALDFNLRILELGASSNRSRANINRVLGEASQTFSIDQGENTGAMIFIDDIDVVLEPDVGFYKGLESIINITKCPVIMACESIPDILVSNKLIKICKLKTSKANCIELVKAINPAIQHGGELELENLYLKARGNLNAIFNYLCTKVTLN
jgi:ATPase family associated with various cellular activities (AAA)